VPKRSSEDERSSGLQLALALLVVAAEVWFVLIPEHRRKEILLNLTKNLRTISARLARRVGQREMGAELRGERPAYELSYFLSCLRDGAASFYERLRAS
jgi:hypothetical protein